MARAYIVLARNDLDDSLLQVLDLKPNATPSIGSVIYGGSPQGGYQTFYLLDGVNAPVATKAGAGGGASLDVDGDTYGLSAYLLDNVEDTGAGESLTAAEAIAISILIEADVASGTALTLARINTHINTPAGVAGSDLDGTLGNSTGTVEEVLRILAGERYKLPNDSQVREPAGTFDPVSRGLFVEGVNVEVQASRRSTYGNARGIRGRASTAPITHIRPGEPRAGQAPTQGPNQDVNFNNVRATVDTGALQLSAASGTLSELKSATFSFINGAFTYGGGASPAQDISGTNIPATGVGRAVVVYDASGNII